MRNLVLLLWLGCLASCQLKPEQDLVYQVADGSYQLRTTWPGQPQQLLQQVRFSSVNSNQEFMLSVQLLPEQLLLVALSPVGHELWRVQLTADGQLLHQGIEPFSERAFALRLLAEMQWSLWPVVQVMSGLDGIQLIEQSGSRQVLSKSKSLLRITGAGVLAVGQITVLQQADYQLTLTTLEQEFL
jgi:hypothetical protein